MNFGKLNEKITIQTPPTAKDDGGELTGSWTDVSSPWAQLKPASSSESKAEGGDVVTDTTVFVIRYRSGITPKMRISYGSDYWQIVGIQKKGRNEYLELTAILKNNW